MPLSSVKPTAWKVSKSVSTLPSPGATTLPSVGSIAAPRPSMPCAKVWSGTFSSFTALPLSGAVIMPSSATSAFSAFVSIACADCSAFSVLFSEGLFSFFICSLFVPKSQVRVNATPIATAIDIIYFTGWLSVRSIANIPVTPVAVAPRCRIEATIAPQAPPIEPNMKGFTNLRFTPNIAGSVMPSIQDRADG